ncbi:DUF397 domain-containing protein [Salinactinospora qingdaonensis]|uniref:DUF397 domain-containing protein n=1 Tax=Salinactinospora qingdaonensis TaxID=702744 RepID=A0ABP7FIT6_9ACTN
MEWIKSSYSNSQAGSCVEVAEAAATVYVRDTQHRELGHLAFSATEWTALLSQVKDGRL